MTIEDRDLGDQVATLWERKRRYEDGELTEDETDDEMQVEILDVQERVIGDMPFLSYQTSPTDAVRNAGRFHKEAGVDAIKLEGGLRVCPQIKAIADGGMLVMGHIGLTPQSSGQLGGFKAQGRTAETAKAVIEDAHAIEEAGAFALLVEAVPPEGGDSPPDSDETE